MQQQANAVIVICSTPESRRIPRKCFKLINGITALEHILNRVKDCGIDIILAIPDNLTEQVATEYWKIKYKYDNVDIYEGSPASPLARTHNAITDYQLKKHLLAEPKYIIRITHDDILIDSRTLIDMLAAADAGDYDYAHSAGILDGAGVEIIRAETIHKKAAEINYPVEHLSYFVKGNRQLIFKPRESISRPYRLTMDYPEDVVVLENVLRSVGNNASIDAVCAYLDNHQQTLQYNRAPDLTIYTCCYNAEKYIAEAIQSVIFSIKNSYRYIEYIIIDDKSTDKTLEIILNQVGLWDNGDIKIIANEQNVGLASGSNIALAAARGRYIMRLDADDILNCGTIDFALDEIITHEYIVLYPSHDLMNGEGIKYKVETNNSQQHHAGGALMNKRAINELKFKEGLKHWDSLELYTRLKDYPELKVGHTEIVLFRYRQHVESLSYKQTSEREAALESIKGGHPNCLVSVNYQKKD